MNDEIKARLLKYADQLENAASKGADFVGEHAPETVHQYLVWNFWSAALLCSLCCVLACVGTWSFIYFIRQINKAERDFEPLCAGALVSVLATGLLMIPVLVNLFTALKIAIAPNVFILEQLAELVK